jgi:hypothetical protein
VVDADAGCGDAQSDSHNCGVCGHDCLGGQCITGVCRAFVLVGNQGSGPGAIAVDATYVYWTLANAGLVRRALIDGTGTQDIWTGGAPLSGLATLGGRVYVASYGDGTIHAMDSSGANVGLIASSQIRPWSVAVAPSLLAWTNHGDGTADSGATLVAALDGGGAFAVARIGMPTGLATDGVRVVWTDDETPGAIYSTPADGGAPFPIASTPEADNALDVAMDATHVYWTTAWAAVQRAPIGGGTIDVLATAQNNPGHIIVDGTSVYWTNYGTTVSDGGAQDGTVMMCAKSGCNQTPTVLASAQANPQGIAQDATALYWVNHGSFVVGAVMKLAKR